MAGARRSSNRNFKLAAFGWKPLAVTALVVLSAAAGCSLLASPPSPVPPMVSAPAESSHARELAAALVERGRELVSMQTAAVMEYREADQHLKARERIMVRRPADLRVEALSPFGLALVVAANDSHLEIFDPSSDTLYTGDASAESLNRFARIPLAPKPAVNLLMGLAPENGDFVRQPDSVRAENGLLIAAYKNANGSLIELGFEAAQLALVRERRQGVIDYEVRYSDYRDIGGFQLAHRIEADFPRARTHVNFSFQHPIINGVLADSLFALKPGPPPSWSTSTGPGSHPPSPVSMDRARRKALRAAAAGFSIAAALLMGCHIRRPANDHAREQVLYSATISDPKTFNPILVTDSGFWGGTGNLFEGLVRIDPMTTLPEPDLAESWEIGDGGRLITFHLRRDVKWQDGEPFTSRDVVFTMRAIYDPRVPNSERPILTIDGKPIEVEAPDDHTVGMTLPRPFAPLLYSIGFDDPSGPCAGAALNSGRFNRTWGIDTPPDRTGRAGAVPDDALRAGAIHRVQAQSRLLDAGRTRRAAAAAQRPDAVDRAGSECAVPALSVGPDRCLQPAPGRGARPQHEGRSTRVSRSRRLASTPDRCFSPSTATRATISTTASPIPGSTGSPI